MNMWIALFLCVAFVAPAAAATSPSVGETTCPVCFRIISSVMDSSLTKAGKASQSYDRYCSLTSIPVEETQFCYNTNGIKAEIHRLLDLGANAERICKKVNKVNPDFCTTKESDFVLTALENPDSDALLTNNTNFKAKRGFIYI